LSDNTSWFIATDFDKENWAEETIHNTFSQLAGLFAENILKR